MSNHRYAPEFKDEAVRQMIDPGHTVAELLDRLGVSTHSLYNWVKSVKPAENEKHQTELLTAKSEVLKHKPEPWRTEEERDI